MRVGDDLETMDRLRTRASEARDIITYYYEFAKGDLNRWVRFPRSTELFADALTGTAISIETLRKEGRDGRAKVANILRRLASVAKEIEDVEGGEAVSAALNNPG